MHESDPEYSVATGRNRDESVVSCERLDDMDSLLVATYLVRIGVSLCKYPADKHEG